MGISHQRIWHHRAIHDHSSRGPPTAVFRRKCSPGAHVRLLAPLAVRPLRRGLFKQRQSEKEVNMRSETR